MAGIPKRYESAIECHKLLTRPKYRWMARDFIEHFGHLAAGNLTDGINCFFDAAGQTMCGNVFHKLKARRRWIDGNEISGSAKTSIAHTELSKVA